MGTCAFVHATETCEIGWAHYTGARVIGAHMCMCVCRCGHMCHEGVVICAMRVWSHLWCGRSRMYGEGMVACTMQVWSCALWGHGNIHHVGVVTCAMWVQLYVWCGCGCTHNAGMVTCVVQAQLVFKSPVWSSYLPFLDTTVTMTSHTFSIKQK